MNTGFNGQQGGDQDDYLKRLLAMLNDTGSGGLKALMARLFGGVAPTQEGGFGFGSSGGSVGGGGGTTPGGENPGGGISAGFHNNQNQGS